jgi:hypothetical protein
MAVDPSEYDEAMPLVAAHLAKIERFRLERVSLFQMSLTHSHRMVTSWNMRLIVWLITKKLSLRVCRDYPAPCVLGSLRGEGVGNDYLPFQSAAGLACAARGMDAAAGLAARPFVAPNAGGMAAVGS